MDDAAFAPRSRRAILAGAIGGLAAVVAGAFDRPASVAASDPNDVVLGIENTTTGETKIFNNTIGAGGVVFTGQTLSGEDAAGLRGYSTGGPGVRGDSVAKEGVRASSQGGHGVRASSDTGFGVLAISAAHGAYGWSHGEGVGVIGYENYVGSGDPGPTPVISDTKIGVLGHATSGLGIGVKGNAPSGIGVRGVGGNAGVEGSSENGTGVSGVSTNGTGIEGISGGSQGVGVYAQAQAVGVAATSSAGRGVQATSDSGTAVYAASQQQTAVFGFSGTSSTPFPPTKVGVFGHAQQDSTAKGVYGRTTLGSGVYGEATTGIGVRAVATTGVALGVSGRMTYSRSGRTSIPANRSYIDVVVPGGLASSANVIATLQTYRSGVAVAACRINYPASGSVRIYLTKVASTTSSTSVFWMVVG